MQLTHRLELPAPVDRTFDVFSRLDLLAPCFPGASVWGRDGDVYHGAVKIKFGPFPLVFEGTARVVRADASRRRVEVKANARDRRGAAAGAATVTASFRPAGSSARPDPDRTLVEVSTELDLTGRPAQLGAGAIASVSDRLKDQFAGCLAAKLAAGSVAPEPTEADDSNGAAEAAEAAGGTPTRVLRPDYTYAPPPNSEAAPHLQVLPDVARTWLPWAAAVVGSIAALVLVLRWLRGR